MRALLVCLFDARKIVVASYILAFASFILCGCSTPIIWKEDARTNSNELVKISGDWETNYKVYIIKIDGKPMRCDPLFGYTQTAYVKPGQHTLFFGYESFNGSHTSRTVRLTAEAGKTYAIHRRLDGYSVIFSVEDVGTGKIIGE